MIAALKHSAPLALAFHTQFLEMLPEIHRRARFAFAALPAEVKEEMIEEVIAAAFCAFCRLGKAGRVHAAYPPSLASYAIRQVRSGRRVGARLNKHDVSSAYAQRMNGLTAHSLDGRDEADGSWREVLIEDRKAGPAETAAARMDVSAWLVRLGKSKRQIAQALARGEATADVARHFHLSPGRISQLRRELEDSWYAFQGEVVASSATTTHRVACSQA